MKTRQRGHRDRRNPGFHLASAYEVSGAVLVNFHTFLTTGRYAPLVPIESWVSHRLKLLASRAGI